MKLENKGKVLMFFLIVGCLAKYKADEERKYKELQLPQTSVVTNTTAQNPYNEIYDKIMAVPEEPKYEENQYDWYAPYNEPKNEFWRYEMPRKEFWEWERDFLDNWRR